MTEPKRTMLWYKGTAYPQYLVYSDRRLYRILKKKHKVGPEKGLHFIKLMPLHLRKNREIKVVRSDDDHYLAWYPKNPTTGKHNWIVASRAVQDSFKAPGVDTRGLVAAHNHGRKRSDGGLGDCILTTQKENCEHKKRDGTHSTGHNTRPGKLKGKENQIREYWERFGSIRAVADWMDVARNSIRRKLIQMGLLKKNSR